MWWLYSFVSNIYHTVWCFVASPLQPWSYDPKTTSEKSSYLDEGWLVIGSFKVGSVPGMKNKEVLAQFIYKPA